MRDLPLLMFIDVSAAAWVFSITWLFTRKSAWWQRGGAALAGWFVLASIESLYWGMGHIDWYNPRPATPLLVPAHVIFAALWAFAALASLSRRVRLTTAKAAVIAGSTLVALGGMAAVQWPSQAEMSYVCEDHLRYQWLVLHFYAEKNHGNLPASTAEWARAMPHYYRPRPDLLKCPADRSRSETSYLVTPQAAGKSLNDLDGSTILLLENKPRHRGKAHALTVGGEVIDVPR